MDRDTAVQYSKKVGNGHFEDAGKLRDVVEEMVESTNPRVRRLAAVTVDRLSWHAPDAADREADVLYPLLTSERHNLLALRTIGVVGSSRHTDRVARVKDDTSDPMVAEAVDAALRRLDQGAA